MSQKRILFVVLPEKGHINPIIGVAQCIYKMNFEIAFFSQEDISEQLSNAGIKCKCFTPQQAPEIPEEFMVHGKDFAQKLKDKQWMQLWIKTLLIDCTPFLTNALDRVAKSFEPQIIVSDPMVYATAIVAENHGIPWAGISNSLNPLTPRDWKSNLIETLDKYSRERLALFSSLNREVDFRVADLISPWLNTVFACEEYIPREFADNRFSFYAGAPFHKNYNRGDETDFPFERIDQNKKVVYMSLGSMVFHHPHLFITVAKALEGLNVQLILSVGDLYYEDFTRGFSDSTIVLPYVPQLQVLDKVDVMVSHGGANSVLECMSKGIPMALLPLCNDQFFQARFLTRAKTGIVLDANNLDIVTYRKELTKLLTEENVYKDNAQYFKNSLKKYGGSNKVANLICTLFENKEPIMPLLDKPDEDSLKFKN